MNTFIRTAPAKVNLALDILGRRPDGYHELRMVMQSISLCDTVTVRTDTGSGAIAVSTGRADLPGGPDNIAWKAAAAFYAATGVENSGTEIALEKRIPMQAGLAGGSADGAAVLLALRERYLPEMSLASLEEIGLGVGSDVPFCIRGGTALAEGRGERLTDLPPLPDCWLLLCKPDFGLSTPALFGRIHVDALKRRPDVPAMVKALEQGDLEGVGQTMRNVFEEALSPEEGAAIRWIETQMRIHGAVSAVMTGSGPTVFGLFRTEHGARGAEHSLRSRYTDIFLANPVNPV